MLLFIFFLQVTREDSQFLVSLINADSSEEFPLGCARAGHSNLISQLRINSFLKKNDSGIKRLRYQI